MAKVRTPHICPAGTAATLPRPTLIGANGFVVGGRSLGWRLRHPERDATAGSALDGALSRRKNRRHRWTGHPHRSAGVLARIVACPVPPEARPGCAEPGPGPPSRPACPPAPLVVTRRISVRGAIMVGGQGIQVGLAHARKTVAVTVGPDTIQVAVETSITVSAARTTSRDIRRHKASNYG